MKCNHCFGSGMIQTGSFGPKPCPYCNGKGYTTGNENTSTGSYKTMGYGEIIFYSVLSAGIGYLIWQPLVIFLPFLVFVYLQEKYQ